MGKNADYKKKTMAECHWCDYSCRKGHRCSRYKKFAKKFSRRIKGNLNGRGE